MFKEIMRKKCTYLIVSSLVFTSLTSHAMIGNFADDDKDLVKDAHVEESTSYVPQDTKAPDPRPWYWYSWVTIPIGGVAYYMYAIRQAFTAPVQARRPPPYQGPHHYSGNDSDQPGPDARVGVFNPTAGMFGGTASGDGFTAMRGSHFQMPGLRALTVRSSQTRTETTDDAQSSSSSMHMALPEPAQAMQVVVLTPMQQLRTALSAFKRARRTADADGFRMAADTLGQAIGAIEGQNPRLSESEERDLKEAIKFYEHRNK